MITYKYGIPTDRVKLLAKADQYEVLISNKGIAMGIPTLTSDAFGDALGNAKTAHAKVLDKDHCRHVDYLACDQCFGTLTGLMLDLQDRYFKIPPCTQGDLDDVECVAKVLTNEPKPKPVGSCYCSVKHTAPGQIVVFAHELEGSLPDVPGSRKGIMVRSALRSDGEPRQDNPELLTRVDLCGGMKKPVDYGAANAGKTGDVSVAYKNGSGETGPFSPVVSFILS
jgi:hypothetical protein